MLYVLFLSYISSLLISLLSCIVLNVFYGNVMMRDLDIALKYTSDEKRAHLL